LLNRPRNAGFVEEGSTPINEGGEIMGAQVIKFPRGATKKKAHPKIEAFLKRYPHIRTDRGEPYNALDVEHQISQCRKLGMSEDKLCLLLLGLTGAPMEKIEKLLREV
jgi:hypothetical protein